MDADVASRLIDALDVGVAVWRAGDDVDSTELVYVNDRAMFGAGVLAIAGIEDAQIAGGRLREHVHASCVDQRPFHFADATWHRGRAYHVQIVPVGERRAVTAWTDVTEHVLALRARKEDLRRTLYVLSHDLRKPIRHMIGFAEAFIEDVEERGVDSARGYLDEMRAAGHRMDRLLDAILAFARLGHVDRWEVVELADVWRDAVMDYVIDVSGPQVNVSIGDNLPRVLGSRAMIQQLLTNLVANAAKFCPSPLSVRLDARPCKDVPHRVCVEVQDDGPGIPVAQRDDVFTLFRRGPQAKDVPGMGLGLAVCRWIAEAHGGSIHVADSERGARFVIHLPAASAAPAPRSK